MITLDLSPQTAVVTGGNSGIGQGIVQILLQSGARVISADLAHEGDYKEVNGQLFESRLDLSRSEDIYRWSNIVLEQAGIPDIVVNCAGTSTMDYVIDSKLEDWEKVFSINSTGLYLVSKIFAKAMVDAGKPGRIIQMASQAGKNGYRAMGGYCASKHAVLGLTKVMAIELARHNILVNAICPGIVETPMKHRERIEGGLIRGMTAEEIYAEDCSQIPLGRTAEVRDVANVALFLASSLSSYMTGQAINVTGGMTMH
ncbi:MAG: SDR family NAD(P)-dependent oxidoreductase [Paenibacillus macerans]|uniref:SDR family oxidoreductase n=1 Tax=Paenibacillus macerans TaxID=44252 RepID=A0A6N8EZ35_PAEMA|nr:SDR family NAD(P)-dependent oxidoreductase [Paenibacillus macerans]MBS5911828.1 SDR family oxidoreductase [Paenibacillus macerans]MDU7472212.1 SDR family NAD(P)-dependent oxidoreductase [Paenibacillus macerans]MEC0140424.1 SDR family NAD(P)-dependent oxidoreductase [Paenibacillus macerans]MEC0332028.1 SDR family NAD(P)-dependent oxidoreductase [Paenibacillus macerans]MUG23581.1 SDR family oxidoreductase [Paenibacillus macerans]